MAQNTESLTTFINRRISIIYLIVLVISVPLIYYISIAQVEKEASSELRNLVATFRQMSPELLESKIKNENSAASGIAKLLLVHNSYFYRYIDVNQAQGKTQFSEHNQKLISQFQLNVEQQSVSGKMTDKNLQLIYKAFPVRTFADELEGFVMFGIKLDNYSTIIIVRVATFIGMMTILYAVIISSINTTLRSHVINPLLRINNRTRAVANGEIDKVFESQRKDEVGELIKSIELLRRSLSISMNMHQKNTRQ